MNTKSTPVISYLCLLQERTLALQVYPILKRCILIQLKIVLYFFFYLPYNINSTFLLVYWQKKTSCEGLQEGKRGVLGAKIQYLGFD
jgi:hypothetical protein